MRFRLLVACGLAAAALGIAAPANASYGPPGPCKYSVCWEVWSETCGVIVDPVLPPGHCI